MATRKKTSSLIDGADGTQQGTPKRARAKSTDRAAGGDTSAKRARRGKPEGQERVDAPARSGDGTASGSSATRGQRTISAGRRGAAARRPVDEIALYQSYFKLHRAPFSIAPDPRALFESERHREALAHLLFGVQGGAGGFVLLTGEIGAGKTTVSRVFLEKLPSHCQVAWILNPRQSPAELLASICEEFGAPVGVPGARPKVAQEATAQGDGTVAPTEPGEVLAPDEDDLRLDPVLHHSTKRYVDALSRHLLQRHARGWQSVLIIDEAQNLSLEVLEQLRLLTNLETHDRKLLQIVLIGQPELRTMLAGPSMEQLAQRIIARYHLGPLNEQEVVQYVRHRLEVAGLQGPLPFHPQALSRIHRLTQGIPRRINLLCDRALLGAYAQRQGMVDAKLVDQAQAEVTGAPAADAWSWMNPRRWGDSSMTVTVLLGVTLGVLILLLFIVLRGNAVSASGPVGSPEPPATTGAGSNPPGPPAAAVVQPPAAGAATAARPNSPSLQPVR
ncbi:MAG: ExeA family protein [Rubrivivax sp.]